MIFPLLDNLLDDSSLYVRRSVANCLNDISKDHPEQMLDFCDESLKSKESKNRQWIVKHACRSLLKKKEPRVFALLGYTSTLSLEISSLKIQETVEMGAFQEMEVILRSTSSTDQYFVLDYEVDYQKAHSKRSQKVFKWKNVRLKVNETLHLSKKHSFKSVSVRKLYKGSHKMSILCNGQPMISKEFTLTKEK